mgnify:CR=1 FL=1
MQKHLWATRDLFSTDVHGIVRCGPQLAPPRFRLAYIPCRNRGEILRLILEESGAEYELEVVGFKNWETGVKETTPHGKLPVLRDADYAKAPLYVWRMRRRLVTEVARALLRGSGVNIVKVALSNSIGFALYETAKDTLGVDGRKPPWVKKREAASRRGRGAGTVDLERCPLL